MVDHIKICEGISDISDSYNGFLIDQWGTLHDGKAVFPEVIETLTHLKSRGKQIILISNSAKTPAEDLKRVKDMGLTRDLFDHIVTSASVMRNSLEDRNGVFEGVGDKCFLMNRHGYMSGVDEINNVTLVNDIEEADFILLTGSDAPEKTLDNYYDALLKKASRKQIKMICANPEKTITIDGEHFMGSGDIARRYDEVGGVVIYIGKPYPSIFKHAMDLFKDLYQSQVCMIGDSLANDMLGAKNLDMDCALIASGMHKGSFKKVLSRADIHKVLKLLGTNYGVEPTYFIPKFHWGKALPDRKNKRKSTKK